MAALDMMFCAAPTKTASMSGVVPSAASGAAKVEPVRQSAKKATPVARRTAGVIMAAVPQPHLRKTKRPKSIMPSVTTPVADEKPPMKAEYAFGSGKACLSLPFHVTSTRLIDMP